ncbi:hypothetical protein L3C95_30185 [Chitinophaga filiformis]|uniref:hypothetical protein n=1 Tax=Chitinophaga filiformis TaxID=104663 RepID=UPI001F2F7D0A|nr:hypothetical protein [Chitinophaga filiformis]MCF6407204.1 hypothetical protein [Chitinophaga filiformis]
MLEKHLQVLSDVRSSKIPVSDFHFQQSEDEDICDNNQRKRSYLIIALLYDPLPTDEPLLRELFLQEILRAENDAFQGIGDAMTRNATLLARFKNPENVWLFTRAKQANFDTSCGFDYEFLVSAGIDESYDFVDSSQSEWKDAFYAIAGPSRDRCNISTEILDDFEQRLQFQLEASLDDTEDQIELAIELDEKDIIREKVAQWKTEKQEWTAAEATALDYYEQLLGNTEGRIAANELALTLESRDFMKENILNNLCALYLKTGNTLMAWDRMQSSLAMADPNHWLSGDVVARLFEIVCALNSPEHPIAAEAFSRGMRELPLLPPAQLRSTLKEMAGKATIMMGDKKAIKIVSKMFPSQ